MSTEKGAEPAAVTAPAREPHPAAPSLLRQWLGNLRLGARLALLRRVASASFHATPGLLALLVLSDLLLNFGVSFLLIGPSGAFAPAAIPGFFFHFPLFLFGGFLAGRLLKEPRLVTVVPVALISLSIPIELCHGVLERLAYLPRLGWMAQYLEAPSYYRFFWWWLLAALIFLVRLVRSGFSRRFLLVLLFILLFFPLWYFPRGDLWVSASEGGESGQIELNEKVLAAQARLLDEQLAALLPSDPEGGHLYFVGFAGDASQDVFLKEVMATERLFSSRFDTARRSVILANNPQTGATLPFASVSNLERTLVRVGQVMNRERDVLVLFLTSHGSQDQELTVSNGPLELDPITPEAVRRILKKSGIRFKVVIVSACFAGGFIEPLKDDGALIVTAADATHESFGCGYGENMTWFGLAYVDRALRQSYSFTKAFEEARKTIETWEKEQGETPSNPQIWEGKAIAPVLEEVEQGLEKGTREP